MSPMGPARGRFGSLYVQRGGMPLYFCMFPWWGRLPFSPPHPFFCVKVRAKVGGAQVPAREVGISGRSLAVSENVMTQWVPAALFFLYIRDWTR